MDLKSENGSCEVLCIGQAVIDCITRGQEPDRHRENVFRAERIELHIGGDAVNESIALTELGHRAAIACGVGEDPAGTLLRTELLQRGVDTRNIAVDKQLTTPIAQLVVHQDGGRHSINSRATMLCGYAPFADEAGAADKNGTDCAADKNSTDVAVDKNGTVGTDRACGAAGKAGTGRASGAAGKAGTGRANGAAGTDGTDGTGGSAENEPVPARDRMLAAMEGVRIVSLASLFRAPLDRAEVIRALVTAAKEAGAIVSADTKLPTFREVPVGALADVWPMVDYIFPNEREAAYYTGETDYAKMAEAFRRLGVRNVVIKAGAEGCYVSGQEGAFHLPALPVEVVDSTGAGDNFVAGFLSGVLRGESLRACAERGRARAAECISRMGASG